MNIYEIDRKILELVDPETGEIVDWAAFDALQMERNAKIENLACWIKNLSATAKEIREEELRLQERRKNLERMVKTRKAWLKNALCGQKFETPRCVVSFRKTSNVDIDDTAAVIAWVETTGHTECVRYKALEISKTEVAKLLKTGAEIPGAALVQDVSMGVK